MESKCLFFVDILSSSARLIYFCSVDSKHSRRVQKSLVHNPVNYTRCLRFQYYIDFSIFLSKLSSSVCATRGFRNSATVSPETFASYTNQKKWYHNHEIIPKIILKRNQRHEFIPKDSDRNRSLSAGCLTVTFTS